MRFDQQATINQLEREREERRAALQQLASQLAAAEERYKSTRHEADGRSVLDLDGRFRLAELAVEGVQRDLEQAQQPRTVAITGSREDLERLREQITTRRDYRETQRQRQINAVTGGAPAEAWPPHIRATLKNMRLEPPAFEYRREDQRDAESLADIDAQLAALDDLGPNVA